MKTRVPILRLRDPRSGHQHPPGSRQMPAVQRGVQFRRSTGSADEASRSPIVGLPSSFKLQHQGDELRIIYRWFRHDFWFFAVWCTGWMGISSFMLADALLTLARKGLANGLWGAALALGGMWSAGLVMTYYALTLAFNRTVIRLSGLGELSVRHGPIPWRGSQRLNAGDIKQLFCLPTTWTTNGRPHYDVWLLRTDLTRHKFLGGLPDIEQALFIEQTLESALELPDEPVPGEIVWD